MHLCNVFPIYTYVKIRSTIIEVSANIAGVIMDILTIRDRIQNSIELGESHFREFKGAWEGPDENRKGRDAKLVAKDIGEALVSFANADGGELLVGVEDNGTITGLPYKESTSNQLLEAYKNNVHLDTPLESVVARLVDIANKNILYFAVEKSTRYIHLTSEGRCLQRRDKQNLPVAVERLQFERQEQKSREFDRQFIDGAKVNDLDLEMIRRISDIIAKGMSPEKLLQFLGLAEYGVGAFHVRRAALLLFAVDVSRWHPRCGVRIVRVRGTELRTGREYNAISDEVATGNIINLLTSAWEKLRPHLVETKLAPDALFKERVMYPEDACREALINAIAHRDYSNEGSNAEIFIFDDRMEVRSPGSLLSTVRLDELKRLQGLHQSRNALIARVLREIGYMREVGEGMRRIFSLMREHDLVSPELASEPSRFSITLRHRSVFSDADQRWLDSFKALRLTREEMLVALLGKNGDLVSPQQIWDTLGLVDTDHYRSIVEQMQTKGILYNAVPRQKSRRAGISNRGVKRLMIRQPEDIDKEISALISALNKVDPFPVITEKSAKEILALLPEESVYRSSVHRLMSLLKALGFIDENREPSSLLHGIWKIRTEITSKTNEHSVQKIAQPINEPMSNQVRNVKVAKEIYVGNIDYQTKEKDLTELFGKFGRVLSVSIPLDYSNERNRGFAFVRLDSEDSAESAIRALNGTIFQGQTLRISWSRR